MLKRIQEQPEYNPTRFLRANNLWLPTFQNLQKARDEEMGEVLHGDYKKFESKHYNLKDIFTLPCFETSNKSL